MLFVPGSSLLCLPNCRRQWKLHGEMSKRQGFQSAEKVDLGEDSWSQEMKDAIEKHSE